MALREQLKEAAPQLSAAVPLWMLAFVALTIVLTVTERLGLSAELTTSWVFTFFGVSAVLGIVLSIRFRQPLVFTGHILVVILFGSLGSETSFPELVGAAMIAGAIILILGATGITGKVTSWIPEPIVMGLIAGAVLPFVADMFTSLGTEPLVVGAVIAAFVASQVFLDGISPIIPALVVGVVVAGLAGQFGEQLPAFELPQPVLIVPAFSIDAIVAALPVLIVLVLAANIPSVIYLRNQGYEPPERALNMASGGATIIGSLFGPMAVAIPTPVLPIIGGPDAGPIEHRYRASVASSVSWLVIALGAATAAPLAMFLPRGLIVSVAGLALLSVLAASLRDLVTGPLTLAPVVAFAVVMSDIALIGLGPFFWGLVLGTSISLVVEREGWKRLQDSASAESDQVTR